MTLPSLNPPQLLADWHTDMRLLMARQEHEFYWILDACAHPDLPGILWDLDEDPQALPLYMTPGRKTSPKAAPGYCPPGGMTPSARGFFRSAAKGRWAAWRK